MPPPVPVSPRVPAAPSAVSARFELAASAGQALTIVAIADDPALLEAIARAAREGDLVIASPTADRFIDQLVANAATIAIIDSACAPPPLQGFVERVHAQFPQLLLIVAGSATLQAALASKLVDGTLFRFAHKPASAQRMQLFVDAARRHIDTGAAGDSSARAAQQSGPPAPPATSPLRSALLGAALLAAVLSLICWQLRPASVPLPATFPRSPAPAPAVAAARAPAPVASPSPAPAATNALPTVPAATDPVANDADARATATSAPLAAPAPSPADSTAPFLELARARLASHDLIEPAGDSALFYIEAAQALAPRDPQIGAVALALGESLIAQARQALNAGDLPAARRWLRACTEYRISAATIADLSARLQQLEAAAPRAAREP